MDSGTPALKWTAAVVGVVLVCFCVGYFIVGKGFQNSGGNVLAVAGTPIPSPVAPAATPSGGGLVVDEQTAAIEAKQKAAAEAKKKADDAAKKKADDAAKKKADEDAAAAAAAANNPTPAPDATPTPLPGADAGTPATPDPNAATPSPPSNITPPPADTVYRVRVGSFATRDAAKTMATELNGRGYAAIVVSDGASGFRLQVGAYKDRKTADGIQQELKANGYDATVSN